MTAAHAEMQAVFNAHYCSLHVRVTNRAAFALYKGKLEYEIFDLEKAYYADGEDAYSMNKYFIKESRPAVLPYEKSDAEKAVVLSLNAKAIAITTAKTLQEDDNDREDSTHKKTEQYAESK